MVLSINVVIIGNSSKTELNTIIIPSVIKHVYILVVYNTNMCNDTHIHMDCVYRRQNSITLSNVG